MDVTNEVAPMLDAENAYIAGLKWLLQKAGESLTDKAEHDLRMGFRTKALIDIRLGRSAEQPAAATASEPAGVPRAVLEIRKAMEGYTHTDGRENHTVTLSVNEWVDLLRSFDERTPDTAPAPAIFNDPSDADVILRSIEAMLGTLDHSAAIDADNWRQQVATKVANFVTGAAKPPEPPVSAQELRDAANAFDVLATIPVPSSPAPDSFKQIAVKLRKLADWLPAPPDLERRK